jgi:protein TonB
VVPDIALVAGPPGRGRWARTAVSVAVSLLVHAQAALALHVSGLFSAPLAAPVAAGRASIELRASFSEVAGGEGDTSYDPLSIPRTEQVAFDQETSAAPDAAAMAAERRTPAAPSYDGAAVPIEPASSPAWSRSLPSGETSRSQLQPVPATAAAAVGRDGITRGPGDAEVDRRSSPGSRASQGALPDGPPVAAYNPAPAYPAELLEANISGRVVLRVRVGIDGRVRSTAVLHSSGFAAFDAAALEAVRRWRFAPGRQAGRRVEADVAVPVRFVIGDAAGR